ncbi:MFS transporter [Streptomyces sp. NPDC006622]|uniref:MFS transporter n=1 Tax=Streptomyces sp. NPDC006622 TaxID=3155459 RepID=UPI0033A88CEC
MTISGDKVSQVSAGGGGVTARGTSALLFAGLVVGNFLVILDVSILNVALPDVKADLGASAAQLPWTADAYTVIFAGLLMASGAVADRLGPRRVYRLALALFALLSLACAASPNATSLIVGRALLGAAAAGLVPASLALLARLYPEPARRSRAIGSWAALSSCGFIAGPVIGGALVDLGGWRWVFLVNPLIVLVALLPTRGLSGHRPETRKKVDVAGLSLSILGLGALTFGLIDAGSNGWGRPVPLVSLALGVAAFVALGAVERKVETPVLPPALMKLGRVRADLFAGAMASFVFYGTFFGLTLWMIHVRGYSPLETGLAFLPMTLPACFLPWLSGRSVAKFGSRPVILVGFAVSLVSGLGLVLAGSNPPLPLLIVLMLGLTVAGTSVIPAVTADMSGAAPAEYAATAMGALSASRQAGVALGVAVLGTVSTLRTAAVIVSISSAVSLLVIAAVLRKPRATVPGGTG